ncbi:putative oxidoreductase [Cyclonatronum proteinivorum]|uniref:Putative oxidoreductase n=1 Tax=Cyclonatronum proteinivorum TaxID=1457365 RepID=A0A345UIV2_9BACT|nr:Rossmann-like and DUF2520 domain-containing protein [Cyclonatronum proteinivorum]AXJ00404.1 putative oxidoreductase [Cyclonatronum proteinivorum]
MPKSKAQEQLNCTIIGSGRVAKALAAALTGSSTSELCLNGIFARNTDEAERIARNNGAPKYGGISEMQRLEALTFLCVSDDALPALAQQLCHIPTAGPDACVVHLSGAHDLEPLTPLQERGIQTGSLHPLQTFPEGADAASFEGIYASVLGAAPVAAQLTRVARALGCKPVTVDAKQKKQLHLAAVFASNYMVALAALSERAAPGLSKPATQLLRPLMESTLQNLFAKGTAAALTGPVSRGDSSTVKAHLQNLGSPELTDDTDLSAAYRLLGRVAAGIARSDNRLTPETYDELLALLDDCQA